MTRRAFTGDGGTYSGDRIVDGAQGRVGGLERQLNDVPFLRGMMFYGVTLTAGTARALTHGFGERASVMVVGGNLDGTGNVFRLTESATAFQIDPRNMLSVVADANCTLDLWLWPRGSR